MIPFGIGDRASVTDDGLHRVSNRAKSRELHSSWIEFQSQGFTYQFPLTPFVGGFPGLFPCPQFFLFAVQLLKWLFVESNISSDRNLQSIFFTRMFIPRRVFNSSGVFYFPIQWLRWHQGKIIEWFLTWWGGANWSPKTGFSIFSVSLELRNLQASNSFVVTAASML